MIRVTRRALPAVFALLVCSAALAAPIKCCNNNTLRVVCAPSPTPVPTLTATPTATATSTPVITATPTPTNTPTRTPTDTPTATPTFTLTDTPTATPTFTPTNTPTNTPTSTPTTDNSFFVQGVYTGNSTAGSNDNRDISTGKAWTPDAVIVYAADTSTGKFAWFRNTSNSGDDSCNFSNGTSNRCAADRIQAFGAGTFQVGTDVDVNANGLTYAFIALRSGGNGAGHFFTSGYTGDTSGQPRSFTGVGFQPDALVLNCENANAVGAWFTTAQLQADTANRICTINSPSCTSSCCQNILTLDADGFTVRSTAFNTNTVKCKYMAFKTDGTNLFQTKHTGDNSTTRSFASSCTTLDFVLSRGDVSSSTTGCSAWRNRAADASVATWGATTDSNEAHFFEDFSGANVVFHHDATRSCNANAIVYYDLFLCNQ